MKSPMLPFIFHSPFSILHFVMKLFFRQTGESGTPLVILHGVFGSADNWLTVAKVLGERYRVFTVDQRNHGRSPHSHEFDYEVMAADLHEFITDQGLENPVVIGHSMGGKTAMQFAMTYPAAWSKLVVVDIAPKFYPIHHDRILTGLNAIDLTTLENRQHSPGGQRTHRPAHHDEAGAVSAGQRIELRAARG